MASQTTTQKIGTAPAATVERKLRAAWRKERRLVNVRGLCHVIIWAAILILVDLAVDWMFRLPGYGRVILVAVNVGTLVWVIHRQWWRHRRRYDPLRPALRVEKRHPELKSLLVSYVQLHEDVPAEGLVSPSLIRAARREAIHETHAIDFREIIRFKDLVRVLVFAVCVMLFFGAISVKWSGFLATLIARIVYLQDIPYPTRTHIDVITGDVTVRLGDKVTIRARCSGDVPAEGTLYVRPERGGRWERLVFLEEENNKFAYTPAKVFQSFSYYVRVGDAESDEYKVSVVPPPRVIRTEVTVRYPDYLGGGRKRPNSLNLEVPEGATVQWQLTCDRPLAEAALIVQGVDKPETHPMEVDGNRVRLTMDVTRSFPYRFRWTDREHAYVYDDEVQYLVQAVPDAAPQVDILDPTADTKARVQLKRRIAFRAADDHEITKVWIAYTVSDGPPQEWPIKSFRLGAVVWPLREVIPDLKEGDIVTFALEAADNRDGTRGPNVGRSRPLRIEIVSDAEFRRYLAEEKGRLAKEMKRLYLVETEASEEVKVLKDSAAARDHPPP